MIGSNVKEADPHDELRIPDKFEGVDRSEQCLTKKEKDANDEIHGVPPGFGKQGMLEDVNERSNDDVDNEHNDDDRDAEEDHQPSRLALSALLFAEEIHKIVLLLVDGWGD